MSSEEGSRLQPNIESSDTSAGIPTNGQPDQQQQGWCGSRECGMLIACLVTTGLIIYNYLLTIECGIQLTQTVSSQSYIKIWQRNIILSFIHDITLRI